MRTRVPGRAALVCSVLTGIRGCAALDCWVETEQWGRAALG